MYTSKKPVKPVLRGHRENCECDPCNEYRRDLQKDRERPREYNGRIYGLPCSGYTEPKF